MKIRRAKKEDVKEIIKVEKGSGYHKKKFNAEAFVKKLFEDKNEIIYVAEKEKKIIGYRSFNKRNKLADSGQLAIVKKYQRRGIGTKLLKKSLIDAKKMGCNKMVIYVRNTNFAGIGLYNKFNFEVIGIIKQNKKLKLKMEKKL